MIYEGKPQELTSNMISTKALNDIKPQKTNPMLLKTSPNSSFCFPPIVTHHLENKIFQLVL
jgi:hypothetical protein